MKRLTEEATPRHVEVIQYSASTGIRVRGENAKVGKGVGFWPVVLEDVERASSTWIGSAGQAESWIE